MSTTEAKAHLRVEHGLDDALISVLAEAAVDRTLQEVGLAGELEGARTRSERMYVCREVRLCLPVESVDAVLLDGEELAAEEWTLSGNFDRGYVVEISEAAHVAGSLCEIRYTPGFGETVPAWFRVAVCFLLAHYYENRSSVVVGQGVTAAEVPMGFLHLCRPHRRHWFV